MQIFKTTSKEQQDLYEQFVSTHPQGSFLQSPTWGNFQSTLNQEVARYIITDQNTVILTAQFILKTAPVIKKHYLYCPYGPLFSPAAMQSQQDLVKLLLAQLKKDFPQSILTRFEPKETINLTNSIKTLRTQPAKTFVTFLGQTQEQLLSNMHQKTRYNIKVAQRHQVSVKQINWDDKAELVPCIKLLEKTAERQEFKDFPERYYLKMVQNLGEANLLKVYGAYYQEELLASAIIIDYGGTRTYLFGGSSAEHRNVMAPYALHWQIITDAKHNGFNKYDWWGLETSRGKVEGFAQFKIRFGGQEISYPNAVDIPTNKIWYLIYAFLRKLNSYT